MKLANFYLKLTVLLGLATIICTPELRNAQAQASVSESAPVILLSEVQTPTTSLKTTQKSQIHQEKQLEVTSMQTASISIFLIGGVIVIVAITAILRPREILGLVRIREDEVGIVFKTLGRPIPTNQLIARKGEAGSQVNTLAPGWHWFYWSWM